MEDASASSEQIDKIEIDKIESRKLFNGLALLLIGTLVLAATPILIYFKQFSGPLGDQDLFAKFGDFVGGTANPLLSLATIILLVVSILIQRKELKLTTGELALSKLEAEKSRKAFEEQLDLSRIENKIMQIEKVLDFYTAKRQKQLVCQIPIAVVDVTFQKFLRDYSMGPVSVNSDSLKLSLSKVTYEQCFTVMFDVEFDEFRNKSGHLNNGANSFLVDCLAKTLKMNDEAMDACSHILALSIQINGVLRDFRTHSTYKKYSAVLMFEELTKKADPLMYAIEQYDYKIQGATADVIASFKGMLEEDHSIVKVEL